MVTRSIPVAAAVLVLVIGSARATSVLCDPTCVGHAPGEKVEDPRNCRQFYVCLDNGGISEYPVACNAPQGVFDPSVGACVDGEDCEVGCNAPVCKIKCEGLLDVISDPWECGKYYYCDAAYNPGVAQSCPPDRPYFDGVTCTFDETACCESPCTPVCGSGDVQVADPLDCTKYYLCLDEGTPTEETHYTCDPGETFQPTSSLCVAGGTCLTLCDAQAGTTPPYDTTTTVPTTEPTTTTPDCIQFLTCTAVGYFPMCQSCQPMYFECHDVGASGVPMLCPDGSVFNTDPGNPFCVPEDACPYAPSA